MSRARAKGSSDKWPLECRLPFIYWFRRRQPELITRFVACDHWEMSDLDGCVGQMLQNPLQNFHFGCKSEYSISNKGVPKMRNVLVISIPF